MFVEEPPSIIKPNAIIPKMAPIFNRVNIFCALAPDFTSIILMIVKNITENIAILLISISVMEKKNPRYSEKATPTAAILAVLITATHDHP